MCVNHILYRVSNQHILTGIDILGNTFSSCELDMEIDATLMSVCQQLASLAQHKDCNQGNS